MSSNSVVAVLGTPCGATTYTALRLRDSGVDVRHENRGDRGTVCGFWVLKDPEKRKPRKQEVTHFVRLIRHPLRVAESLPGILARRKVHEFYCGDPLKNALRYWVEAHERIGRFKLAMTMHVDHRLEHELAKLCRLLGAHIAPIGDRAPTSKKKRVDRISWAQWDKLDADYAARARTILESCDMPIDLDG